MQRIVRRFSIMGTVEKRIRDKLSTGFSPVHLDVINESYMHASGAGADTHFKVVVVSSAFDSKPLLERHRMVNAVLADEFQDKGGAVHALSIIPKTEQQWIQSEGKVPKSPACQGANKH